MIPGSEIVKQARKFREYTQLELSEGTGHSVRAIQRWEAGTSPKDQAVNDVLTFCQVNRSFIEELVALKNAA